MLNVVRLCTVQPPKIIRDKLIIFIKEDCSNDEKNPYYLISRIIIILSIFSNNIGLTYPFTQKLVCLTAHILRFARERSPQGVGTKNALKSINPFLHAKYVLHCLDSMFKISYYFSQQHIFLVNCFHIITVDKINF